MKTQTKQNVVQLFGYENKFKEFIQKNKACWVHELYTRKCATFEEALEKTKDPYYITWVAETLKIDIDLIFSICKSLLHLTDSDAEQHILEIEKRIKKDLIMFWCCVPVENYLKCCDILREKLSILILEAYKKLEN